MKKVLTVSAGMIVSQILAPTVLNAQTLPAGADPSRVEQRFAEPTQARAQARELRGLESTMPPAQAAQIELQINDIQLTGNTVLSKDEVDAILAEVRGKTVTLSEVFAVAAKITSAYGKNGYLLSRVIVPPQELEPSGASIRLEAVEGYVDEVIWPEDLDRYRNFFDEYGEKITAARPLKAQTLERYLLLASDLPGLTFKSNMKASATNARASTLTLTVEEDPYDLSLSVDNRGTEGSGPLQSTVNGSLNNLAGFHERWSAGYTIAGSSAGSIKPELHYVSFGYSQILNSEGLTFALDGNASWGRPGTEALLALDYKARSLNLSTSFAYPFIRTRSENLTGTIAFDFKNSQSTNFAGIASEDRLRILRAELAYDKADEYNGTNQIIWSVSKGIEGLGSTENGNPNASRTPGEVDFFKTTLSLSRTQQLKRGWSLYGSAFGQWTPDALLSSQECGFGGQTYGRGFDSSIITGDRCFMGSTELRYNLPINNQPINKVIDSAQVYGFADYGHIWNIDAPLGTPEKDDAASAGIGLRFGKSNNFNGDIAVSRTILEPTSTPEPSAWRGWFRLTTRF